MSILLIWYLVASALDIATTYYGISQGLVEGNFLTRKLDKKLIAVIQVALFGSIAIWGWPVIPTFVQVVLCGTSSVAAIHNFRLINNN